MTVTYSREVCTVRLGGFAKLLVRWRGSIYRLMYREVLIFLALFYALALLYRFGLTSDQQRYSSLDNITVVTCSMKQ